MSSNIYLTYLAVTSAKVYGNIDSYIILAIIFSISTYIVVIAYCLHGFGILEELDKRNPVMLRCFESDYLYQRHVALFEDIASSGAVISNYAIKGVLLKDFKIEGDKEILVVALSASINKESIYDDKYKSYILTFARKKGVKTTGTLLEQKETNCPNCGAVLDLNEQGICSYCHTVISNGDFGWILIDMKSIKLVGD